MTCACTAPAPTLMTLYVDLGALPEDEVLSLQQEVHQNLNNALPKVEGWSSDAWVFGFYELLRAFDEVHTITQTVDGSETKHKAVCQTLRGNTGFPDTMITELSSVVESIYREAGERRGVMIRHLATDFETL